jgi:hypothetical protein
MVFATSNENQPVENQSSPEKRRHRRRSENLHHGDLPPLSTNTYSGKAIGTKVMGERSPHVLSPTIYSPFPERIKETSFIATRRHSKPVSLDSIDGMLSSTKSAGRKASLSIDDENPMTPNDVVGREKMYVEYVKIEESKSNSSGGNGAYESYRRHTAANSGTAKPVLDGTQKVKGLAAEHGDSSMISSSKNRPASSSPTTPAKSVPSTGLRNTSSSGSSMISRSSGSTTGSATPSDPNASRIPIAFHGTARNPEMNEVREIKRESDAPTGSSPVSPPDKNIRTEQATQQPS